MIQIRRRNKRRVPRINTASVADISFTLLILFLVVTSMDADKGMSRMLPPLNPPEAEASEMIERNVMRIDITDDNAVLINGDSVAVDFVRERVAHFIDNPENDPSLPEIIQEEVLYLGQCRVSDSHILQIAAAKDAQYDMYFKVLNQVTGAYRMLRDSLAQARLQKPYAKCSEAQRESLRHCYPQRVSEVYDVEGGDR